MPSSSSGGAPALPLMRWANAVATIHHHYGVGSILNPGDPFLTAMAAFGFQVSALLWPVLGTLVTAAQGADAVQLTVHEVDPIYHRIGQALIGTTGATSFVVLVILAGAGMVAYQAYKEGSGMSRALRGLAGVLLPIGVLVVTVNAAAGTADAPGSPSWAVKTVTGWTTTLSGSVAHLFDRLPAAGTGGVDDAQHPAMADCAKYIGGLENLYAERENMAGGGPAALQAADSIVLSQIWEAAVMAPWVNAQFGPGPLGDKAACHLLEIQAGMSAQEQVTAMAADVPHGIYSRMPGPAWSQLVGNTDPRNVGPGQPTWTSLLGPDYANGDDDLRRNMIAWATCNYVGKANGDWKVDTDFANVFDTPPSEKGFKTCSTWWDKANTKPPPTGGTFTTNGPFDFEDNNAIVNATQAHNHDSAAARNYIQGLNGHNAGLAASTSILALGSSITYTWSLGGLALGVLIGKLSLIILVACMPIFLLLAAIPSVTTRRAARKAFGLSFASLLSTFTFSVLMGLLLLFIALLQAMTIGMFHNPGTLAGLIQGLIPLAALYIMRRLLRLVGMESITSLRGAVRTTAAFGQMGMRAGPIGAGAARLGGRAAERSTPAPVTGSARRGGGGHVEPAAAARRSGHGRPGHGGQTLAPAGGPQRPTPLAWNATWRQLVAAGGARALPATRAAPQIGGPFPPGKEGRRSAVPMAALTAGKTLTGPGLAAAIAATSLKQATAAKGRPPRSRPGPADGLPGRPGPADGLPGRPGPADGLPGRPGPPEQLILPGHHSTPPPPKERPEARSPAAAADLVVFRLDAATGRPLAVPVPRSVPAKDQDRSARPEPTDLHLDDRSVWVPSKR